MNHPETQKFSLSNFWQGLEGKFIVNHSYCTSQPFSRFEQFYFIILVVGYWDNKSSILLVYFGPSVSPKKITVSQKVLGQIKLN
jgi:hypothetical protein